MDVGQLKRYYLGGLTESQQADLETQCFENDELFARLMEEQADLVDAYVRNQLSTTDRSAFERHFLSTPDGREKVRLAKALIEGVAELEEIGKADFPSVVATSHKPALWRLFALTWQPSRLWLPVAALATVVIVSIGVLIDDWRVRTHLESLTAERDSLTERERRLRETSETERVRADRLSETLKQLQSTDRPAGAPSPTIAGSVMALSLTPGFTRAADSVPELVIRRGVAIVLLELGLDAPETVGSYRVTLETSDGREVWRQDATRSSARREAAIAIAIPVSTLQTGSYIVRLQKRTPPEQLETLHSYQFRVVTREV